MDDLLEFGKAMTFIPITPLRPVYMSLFQLLGDNKIVPGGLVRCSVEPSTAPSTIIFWR